MKAENHQVGVNPTRQVRWLKLVGISVFLGLLLTATLAVVFQEYLWLPSLWMRPAPGQAPEGFKEEILTTSDGERITLWYHDVEAARKRGTFLVLHGNGDTVRQSLYTQRLLNSSGFSTYAIDYRGTGKSTGWPTEDGLHQDAEAAWKFVVEREGGAEKVNILGHSFGTGLATYLAQRYDPELLILIAPYLSIPDTVSDRWDSFFLRGFLRINLPSRDLIGQMKHTRILSLHGRDDDVIPVHHSEDLKKLYRGKGDFKTILFSNSDHFVILDDSARYIREWLDTVVPPAGKPPLAN
jgi:pimeloyl-ACP methyl ester carboxylesterase